MTCFSVDSLTALDGFLAEQSDTPGVFRIAASAGEPYLGKTTQLRRRLKRILAGNSRLFSLRSIAREIAIWPTASRLETQLVFYRQARASFPATYAKHVRLRFPPWVKVLLGNPFPRTQVTTRLTSGDALFFGPFRTRASAEKFEAEALDLFQVRRCQEDLTPHPEHPGCIYGEMSLCLRPCQQLVGPSEYRGEVSRLTEFLTSGGGTLLERIRHARERASEEMEFEEAQRQHRRYEKVEQVLRLRDELVSDLDRLHGLAILPCSESGASLLWPMVSGCWQEPLVFSVHVAGASLDTQLRASLSATAVRHGGTLERQEHVAMLAAWQYASTRDGEWLGCPDWPDVPYRKAVRAISRVMSGSATSVPSPPALT